MNIKQYKLPLFVFMLTFILLALVQVKVERPMILAERFFKGSGWVEIFLLSCYAVTAWQVVIITQSNTSF